MVKMVNFMCILHNFLKSLLQLMMLHNPFTISLKLAQQRKGKTVWLGAQWERLAQEDDSAEGSFSREFSWVVGEGEPEEGKVTEGKGDNFSCAENFCRSSPLAQISVQLWRCLKELCYLPSSPQYQPRPITLLEGPWSNEVGTSESFLLSFILEHILLPFLRERGIIGQIINNDPPWLPLWQVLGCSPRSSGAE